MINELIREFSIADELTFAEISPGFPVIKINNIHASATISLYGGQLLEYKPHDQAEEVIWLSDQAVYKKNKAIRGGIPICWPWFGDFDEQDFLLAEGTSPVEDSIQVEDSTQVEDSIQVEDSTPAHGYARITFWEVQSTQRLSDGGTQVVLHMPCQEKCQQFKTSHEYFECDLTLTITVSKNLKLDLLTVNQGQQFAPLSEALHSYFTVSDIQKINILGLEQMTYLDKLNSGQSCLQETSLQFKSETDSVFVDTDGEIHLIDQALNRKIIITKENSKSTVIWNPWQEKASFMGDMPEQGWQSMVCIEPANVHNNKILLGPGQTHQLSTLIAVEKLR